MVRRRCFAPNCRSGLDSCKEKRSTFTCQGDDESFKKWQENIPTGAGKVFSRKDILCELHFEEKHFIRAPQIVIGGQTVELEPFSKPKLKKTAVPTIWPGFLDPDIPENQSFEANIGDDTHQTSTVSDSGLETVGASASPESAEDCIPMQEITQNHDMDVQESVNTDYATTLDENFTFSNSSSTDNEREKKDQTASLQNDNLCLGKEECDEEMICLPEGWQEQPTPFLLNSYQRCFFRIDQTAAFPQLVSVDRQALVDFESKKVYLYFHSKLFKDATDWKCCHELSNIIENFDMMPTCKGYEHQQQYDPIAAKIGIADLKNGIWIAKKCQMLCASSICSECCQLEGILKKRLQRHNTSSKPCPSHVQKLEMMTVNELIQRLRSVENDNKNLRGQVIRLTKRLKVYQQEARCHREAVAKFQEESIDINSIPAELRLTYKTLIKRAKCKSKKSMKYEVEWLLQCMLLHTKSPSAYRHLQVNGLMPLPCENTLRRLTSAMKCHFGFNITALEAMKNAFVGKSVLERMGSHSHDEMTVMQGVKYNKQNFCFDGFVDLDEEEYEEDEANPGRHDVKEDQLADHAMVFMFRPFQARWIQPFATFASRGAVPGDALWRLCFKSFSLLHHYDAIVTSAVCDGAQTNKGFWKNIGIGSLDDRGEVKNTIPHPADPDQTIHFLIDPPHLFKCVRNNMLKCNLVQYKGNNKARWETIKELFAEDEKLDVQGGFLRMCPKLRSAHINPTSFEKMSVKLMAQVFSKSVVSALQLLKNNSDESISSSFKNQETDNLIELLEYLNDIFDIMNGRCWKNGIRINAKDPRFKWDNCKAKLKEFDEVIVKTLQDTSGIPGFAATTTLQAFRVTIKSVIDVTNLLFSLDVELVLTGKMNQDCLERFFGIIRSAGGGQDKPTCSTFLQLFRLLSLYYPTKEVIRGANVDNGEKGSYLLTNYATWLRKRFKEGEEENKKLQKYVKDILLDGISVELEISCQNAIEEGQAEEELAVTVRNNIVFYISGYMARRQGKRQRQCLACLETMTTSKELASLNTASELTSLKSHGMLKFSSNNSFKLFSRVEEVILDFVKEGGIFKRNAFYDVASAVVVESLPKVGCHQHYKELMSSLIYDYLILRFNCIAKGKCLKLCEERRTEMHKKMKLAKLGAAAKKKTSSTSTSSSSNPVNTTSSSTSSHKKGRKKNEGGTASSQVDASQSSSSSRPIRKRVRKDNNAIADDNQNSIDENAFSCQPAAKRKRGRPRKEDSAKERVIATVQETEKSMTEHSSLLKPLAVRKRGRPRKEESAKENLDITVPPTKKARQCTRVPFSDVQM